MVRFSIITALTVAIIAGFTRAQCGTKSADDSLQIILNKGESLYSCSGLFYVTYQADGNAVVVYKPANQVLWSSQTASLGLPYYTFQTASANSGRMVMGNNGNLVVYTGDNRIDFSTDTAGTDCKTIFLTDITKNNLVAKVQSSQPTFANSIRSFPCGIVQIEATETGGSSEYFGAPIAGPGALKCRTVINKYDFQAWFCNDYNILHPPNCNRFTIGQARLQKTWCYDGNRVTSAGGGDPAKATVDGEVTILAQVAGFSWQGAVPGTDYDDYAIYNGNGKGAHVSQRKPFIRWEVPVAGTLVAIKPIWSQKIEVKGFSDGKVACVGGSTCANAPNP